MSLFHSFHSLIQLYNCFQRVIFSDAVIDKLTHRIVVLSIAFKIVEFHGFPLHPLGLGTFAVNILRFRFIFTQNLQSVKCKVFQQGIVVFNHRL